MPTTTTGAGSLRLAAATVNVSKTNWSRLRQTCKASSKPASTSTSTATTAVRPNAVAAKRCRRSEVVDQGRAVLLRPLRLEGIVDAEAQAHALVRRFPEHVRAAVPSGREAGERLLVL